MASGALTIGSRTPMAGLPAWVTPRVVRGGFATGTAAAGGPLRPHEAAVAARAGVPAERGTVFAHYLTDAGQAELCALLDSGGYRLEFGEQAALLTVAWLLRAGDRPGALGLLDEIGPYAGKLCFVPVPDAASEQDPSVVWRGRRRGGRRRTGHPAGEFPGRGDARGVDRVEPVRRRDAHPVAGDT